MGVFYRFGQFWQMYWARPLPAAEQAEIAGVLSPAEMALFCQLALSDQWHSYRVLQTLKSAGHDHPDLLVAALLHDIGKTQASLSLWDRSFVVIAEALLPGLANRWRSSDGAGWRAAFVAKAEHPAWGAEMAQAAGSQPLAISLIQRHQEQLSPQDDTVDGRLLRALQWADDLN